MKTTRYEQVADSILQLIKNGVLKEGDKIPSLRQLSKELHVSVNTVKEAYWKLEDRNYIIALPQSGFYVKKQPREACAPKGVDPRALSPQDTSLCRVYGAFQSLGLGNDEATLGIASVSSDFRPSKRLGRFIQEAIRDSEREAFDYMMPPGNLMLREQISRWALSCGANLAPEDIVITNGCHEAIFLALMAVCKPGDAIVFESPIYFSLLQLLQQLNLKIIEIPSSSQEGVSLDTLRFVIENQPVKAMFTISNFNNPLGFSIPEEKKRDLVRLLDKRDIPLIEDDIYGDLAFDKRPGTCKSSDKSGNVLLCSSFSKTIAPGLRVGWIAPGRYYEQVIGMKMLLNIATASVNQIAAARFLKEGGYERHVRMLRKKLKEQTALMRKAILKHFPKGTKVTDPKGGMLLWIELPEEIDAYTIYKRALKRNIIVAPGQLFTVKDAYSNCLRLNAGIWNDNVRRAVEYLGKLCSEHDARDAGSFIP